MKTPTGKYLLAVLLIVPLLSGCTDDDDDDNSSPPPASQGGDPNPNSVTDIFSQPADADPVDPDDPEALGASIEATFGAADDEPQEPDQVLDLSSG